MYVIFPDSERGRERRVLWEYTGESSPMAVPGKFAIDLGRYFRLSCSFQSLEHNNTESYTKKEKYCAYSLPFLRM